MHAFLCLIRRFVGNKTRQIRNTCSCCTVWASFAKRFVYDSHSTVSVDALLRHLSALSFCCRTFTKFAQSRWTNLRKHDNNKSVITEKLRYSANLVWHKCVGVGACVCVGLCMYLLLLISFTFSDQKQGLGSFVGQLNACYRCMPHQFGCCTLLGAVKYKIPWICANAIKKS